MSSRPRRDPATLTEAEIASMTPAECNAACDELDQSLVGVLQEIDETLSKANLIITHRVLPAVQTYGENSQRIWESVKFWKVFFEASANTKLNEPFTGDESARSDQPLQSLGPGGEEQSLSFEREQSVLSGPSDEGTPRPPKLDKPIWSEDASPYEALQADLKQFGIHTSAQSASSIMSQATRDLVAARGPYAPPPESPELALPDFEDVDNLERIVKGKERAFDVSVGSPQPRLRAGADQHHPALLQKILRKNFESPRPPGSSTPGKGLRTKVPMPDSLPRDWNGVVDLSQTPISAFAFPSKGTRPEEDGGDLSPPPSQLSFSFSAANLSRTPAKEAARRVAQDVYEYSESPMPVPPSVMKDVNRMYMTQPSPSGSRRRPTATEPLTRSEPAEEDLFAMPGIQRALADFGGGTTARIDDLLNEDSFAKIVDDEGDGFDAYAGLEDESYVVEEGISETAPEGPEDTLFGMPRPRAPRAIDHVGSSVRPVSGAEGSQFRMLGLDQMDTLHGGQLLESEPFEASPLAGRRR